MTAAVNFHSLCGPVIKGEKDKRFATGLRSYLLTEEFSGDSPTTGSTLHLASEDFLLKSPFGPAPPRHFQIALDPSNLPLGHRGSTLQHPVHTRPLC